MKTNSTFKFWRNLLLPLIGVLLGTMLSFGQTVSYSINQGMKDGATPSEVSPCGGSFYFSLTEEKYKSVVLNVSVNDVRITDSWTKINCTYVGWAGDYFQNSLPQGQWDSDYKEVYVIVDPANTIITFQNTPPSCGATVTEASIDAEDFCVGKTLSVSSDATGTATYEWKKIGSNSVLGTNDDYTPNSDGDYYVLVTVGSTTVSSDTVTIYPGATIITDPVSPISMERELSQVANPTKTIKVTKVCCTDVSYSLSGSGFSVAPGAEAGEYVITFTGTEPDVDYSATLTFSDDDGDAADVPITLNGSVVNCSSYSLSVPETSFDLACSEQGENKSGTKNISVSGINNEGYYKIGIDITGYDGKTNYGAYTIYATINGNSVYNHEFSHEEAFSSLTGGFAIVSGEDLSGGVSITIGGGKNDGNRTTSFSAGNLSVVKVCPPEVKFSSISSECDASASFTATATKGTGNIASYTWYVNNVQQGSAITSSSLSNTWNPASALANGSVVKVVVTDENGLSANATYTINCGPDVNDISAPAEICPGGDLSLSDPSYTLKDNTSKKSNGWEVADSPTSDSWTPLASLNGLSVDYKNKYIRYFVIDNQDKKGKSNAVQITMFDAPEVGTISVDDICKDGTFSLTTPSVTYDAAASSPAWQYSTSSSFATATNFDGSTLFGTAGTYYIRYKVTDACTTVYSNTETVNVNVPSITPSYTTYTRAAGSTGAVVGAATTISTCVGALTYSIVSGNDNNYFAINSSTGEITLTSSATVAGTYSPITVRVTDGSLTRDVNISVTLTSTPTLTVTGCMPSEIWAYTNQSITNVYRVASNYINGDVELSLSGNAASYFSLSQNSVDKNTTQDVTLTLTSPFTLGGNKTLTFTAHDSENDGVVDVVCSTTIHVVNITFTDYVADQVSCSSEANTLRVAVGDNQEDATHLPLSYQWYKDDVAIAGATSATYTPTKTGSGAGQYHCVVSTGGTVVHTTEKADISFVTGVPELSFNEVPANGGVEIPEEVFCSQEVGAVMKVTFNGNDVTDEYDRFWWVNTKSKNKEGITENGEHTFSFSCSDTPTDATIGAYIRDNASGCTIYATKSIHVKEMGNTYYYRGLTSTSSDVTNPQNWCSSPNATAGPSCGNPHVTVIGGVNYFDGEGCEYIINQDNVILQSSQRWEVTGEGSKITIGDGKWSKSEFSSVGNGWSKQGDNNSGYKDYISHFTGGEMTTQMTKVAEHDYRTYAKSFTIEGVLNESNNITVDVTNGSSVIVATQEGEFSFGTLASDEITSIYKDPGGSGYYNIYVNPGSSVTYSGEGAKKIRSGNYSQLYINTDDEIQFENNANITISQVMKNETAVDFDDIYPNGSTVIYSGAVDQQIAAIKYEHLQTEAATNKTLAGNIEATTLTIGAGSTLVAGANNITVTGSGEAVVLDGRFDCGTSTFNYTYTSEESTTVEAMNYYNLNLGSGPRTLSDKNIIGIAGEFTPGTGTRTVTGSTVEFNGSTAQSIPEFIFYDLVLNNTAMRSNPSDNRFTSTYYITQTGRVEVQHNLLLAEGILDTDDNVFIVSNPASSAVGQGYHDGSSVTVAAYINGELTRVLPENLDGTNSAIYYFPVGDDDGYKPLLMNQITTTDEDPQVTVSVAWNGVKGSFPETGAAVNTGYAWHVDGNEGYTQASVGVSSSTSKDWHDDGTGNDYSPNALAYAPTDEGNFIDVLGSVDKDGNLLFSNPESSGYYALLHRNIVSKIYYYDCSGEITDVSSWWTQDVPSVQATDFNETDAKWVISCNNDVTIENPLTIKGANSFVEIAMPKGKKLNINSDVEFIKAVIKKGTVQVGTDGEWTVDYGFEMYDITDDPSSNNSGSYSNRTSLINNGRVNLYLSEVTLTNSYIENNGYLYSENVDWDLSSPGVNADADALESYLALDNTTAYTHTQFINNNKIEMINGNMYATGTIDCGSRLHIRNASNAVWLIDNTSKAGASFVEFFGVEFAGPKYGYNVAFVDLQCNSTFAVKHADVTMRYKGSNGNFPDLPEGISDPAWLGGNILIEDGNLQIGRSSQGGGDFTIQQTCGSIYLNDTDNSGDGILECVGGGGYHITVEGTLYAMGITVADGASGCDFTVAEGGTVFIGNIGAIVPDYSWVFTIKVDAGGTLFYCGNRTAGADGIGTNEGTLYYAGNYYFQTDPVEEEDFVNTTPGVYEQLYATEEQCMNAYRQHLPSFQPVEMTILYGVCLDDNKVELHWQTASETNCSYFTILRSFDGVHFVEIDYITGAGTTTEVHNYEFYDTDDKEGIVYYKLRQVDYDGTYTDSKVIAVQTCGKNARFSISDEEIEVFFRNPQANYVVITSVTGQIFYSKKFTNVEEARIAVPQRKGIYIISVIDNKQITSEKFIR